MNKYFENEHQSNSPKQEQKHRDSAICHLPGNIPDGRLVDIFTSESRKPSFIYALRWRFIGLVILIVFTASTLSLLLTWLLHHLLPNTTNLMAVIAFGFALKDMLIPLLTILVTIVIIGAIAKAVTGPLSNMSDATKKIASGDLSARTPETASTNEIGVLQRNFNLMAGELERNERIQKDFTSNISHEFKTPLAIIQGYSRLLEEDDVSEEDRKKYAGLITRESERLSRLSTNLLRLSKLENQQIIVSPTTFLLDEQIIQAVVLLEPKWSKKNISFDIDMPETSFTGDEELLSQVWLNLAENAIKFSADDDEITIRLTAEAGSYVITITNGGTAPDSETCKNAFNKYYQGNTASAKEGSGLGLSIAQRIVELHKGSISLSSNSQLGTSIEVRLPFTR